MNSRTIFRILAIVFILLFGKLIINDYSVSSVMSFEGVWTELADTETPTPTDTATPTPTDTATPTPTDTATPTPTDTATPTPTNTATPTAAISSPTATSTAVLPSPTTASTASPAPSVTPLSNLGNQAWSTPVDISLNEGDSTAPQISHDNYGNTHVVWLDNSIYPYTYRVMHRMMTAEGVWTVTVTSDTEISYQGGYYAAGDAEGGTHVLANWIDGRPVYLYKSLNADSWSAPVHFDEMINLGITNDAFLVMDNGEVHVVVSSDYARRDEAGTWTIFKNAISYPDSFSHFFGDYLSNTLKTSPDGYLYMVFTGSDINNGATGERREVFLMSSRIGSNWEDAQTINISESPFRSESPRLEIDTEGNPHVLYVNQSGPATRDIYYRTRKNGVWLSPMRVTSLGKSEVGFTSAISPNDVLHVLEGMDNYFERNVNGNWIEIPSSFFGSRPQFSVSDNGTLHLDTSSGNVLQHYLKKIDSVEWLPEIRLELESGSIRLKDSTISTNETVLLAFEAEPFNGVGDIYFANTYAIPRGLRFYVPVIIREDVNATID